MPPTTSSVTLATVWTNHFKIFFTLKANLLILLKSKSYQHFLKYYNIFKRKKHPVKKLDRVFLATDVSRKIYQHVTQIGNKCTSLAK